MRRLLSEIGYSLAVFLLCGLLGGLAGLLFDTLSNTLFSLPFWVRRIGLYLFPAYGLAMGLFFGIQEFIASYTNARVLRRATYYLGPEMRMVAEAERLSETIMAGSDVVVRSLDDLRRIRLAWTTTLEGDHQLQVRFEALDPATQQYFETARLPLKCSYIQQLWRVGVDSTTSSH